MKYFLIISVMLGLSLSVSAQNDVPIERYGIVQTNDMTVVIKLGSDGARGGNQLLLLMQMRDGTTRKFDLNPTRIEWAGGSTQRVEKSVQPPIRYADVARIGVEWHGSHGDITQEQDDVEIASIQIQSRAVSTTPSINNERVDVGAIGSKRLENDTTFWAGPIQPKVWVSSMCTADSQCDDRNYCNGVERCEPSNSVSDPRGCIATRAPCAAGQMCNESTRSCGMTCTDNDGDGHLSAACGGDDCDDNDANRYPGNVEIADAADHDEDCDVNTHGIFRGSASSQICDGRLGVVLVDAREQFTRARCTTGTVCVQQPNGEGVCMVEPSGYQAPTAATLPTGPQASPTNSTSSKKDKVLQYQLKKLIPNKNSAKN